MPIKLKFPPLNIPREPESILGLERMAEPPRVVVPMVPLGPFQDLPEKEQVDSDNAIRAWDTIARRSMAALADGFKLDHNADSVKTEGDRYVLRQADQEIEVFTSGGGFRWTRLSADRENEDTPAKIPDDPMDAARRFLREHGLWDERALPVAVHHTNVTTAGAEKQPISFPIETHVEFRYRFMDLPVFGPGAKLRVTFGRDGEPARLLKFWREPGPAPERDRLSPNRAPRPTLDGKDLEKILRRDPAFVGVDGDVNMRVRRLVLGYFAAPPSELQSVLVPVFLCDCVASTPTFKGYEFLRYVSAVRMREDEWRRVGRTIQAYVRR